MRRRLEAFWAEQGMFPQGCRVLCAVSGGADSVCMLHLLRETPGLEPVCAHFNHGLRGAESDRDEAFVRDLCARLGVAFVRGGGDVAAFAAAEGLGIEEAARKKRYEFLERAAAEHGCDRIATAHNANDNAETVLLHLLRGSGTRGLCGIPAVRGSIVRPLLCLTRAEIEAYLTEHGLSHVEDSSNGGDDHARNRLRHHVLPLLQAENAGAVENICAAAALSRQDEEYLSGLAEHFIMEEVRGGAVPIPALLALPRPVGARVLLGLCPGAQREHIDALLALCRSEKVHGACDLPGLRVVRERDALLVDPAPAAPVARRALDLGETVIPEASWRVCCSEEIFHGEIHNSFNTFYVKRESINGKLYISSREDGDSVRLLGRGCTKSLKKLFAEAHLPLSRRDRVPVLRDDAGVAAVAGFGVAERCAAREGDAALRIEIFAENGGERHA